MGVGEVGGSGRGKTSTPVAGGALGSPLRRHYLLDRPYLSFFPDGRPQQDGTLGLARLELCLVLRVFFFFSLFSLFSYFSVRVRCLPSEYFKRRMCGQLAGFTCYVSRGASPNDGYCFLLPFRLVVERERERGVGGEGVVMGRGAQSPL